MLEAMNVGKQGSIPCNNTTLCLADRKIIHLYYHVTFFIAEEGPVSSETYNLLHQVFKLLCFHINIVCELLFINFITA